ncbi:AAA family ATPase [Streptomyces sp. NPDC093094]|uniref:AAA family ATPase n=1 Tax=Streptomyces sp. NPDC093094 TaxID=3366026 RepID=UPI0037F5C01D
MTGNATNVEQSVRVGLVMAAKRHGMPTAAVLVSTPLSVCLQRQGLRPANRRVPEDVVRAQHQAMTYSHQHLAAEGFTTVVFADTLNRLEPFLKRLSARHEADLGHDGSPGLSDLLLVRRTFDPDILPVWRWKDGSDIAGGDRVAEIRLGQQHLTLALRTDVDGEGDIGFDVMVPCPADPECGGYAWTPACSITDLHRALTGELDHRDGIVCDVHGSYDDTDQDEHPHPLTPAALETGDEWWHSCPQCHLPVQGGPAGLAAHRTTVHALADGQDDDPEGRAALEEQALEAIRD